MATARYHRQVDQTPQASGNDSVPVRIQVVSKGNTVVIFKTRQNQPSRTGWSGRCEYVAVVINRRLENVAVELS